MADRSAIEWTDATWNPVRAKGRLFRQLKTSGDLVETIGWHCEHVSDGCRNCYAEVLNRRLGTGLDFKPGYRQSVEIILDEKMLLQPLRWKTPRMIFVGSMTDLFASFVTEEILDRIFAVMALCPQHTFQVLTKRADRMRAYLNDAGVVRRICTAAARLRYAVTPDPNRQPRAFHKLMRQSGALTAWTHAGGAAAEMFAQREPERDYPSWVTWPLPNVWLGVSVEDQMNAQGRIPDVLATPAAVRFLSCEPLLGSLDLTGIIVGSWVYQPLSGVRFNPMEPLHYGAKEELTPRLDWVIVGGESGRGARPLHPSWARSLRDQCARAGVPFFFKQWGEWLPGEIYTETKAGETFGGLSRFPDSPKVGETYPGKRSHWWGNTDSFTPGPISVLVGKKAAGRVLDGATHDGMPS